MYASESGAVNPLVVSNILVGLLAVGLAAFGVWSYVNYTDQKDNVDSKVAVAVADAKKEQAAKDEADFVEREKEPNRTFVGPDDLGRVTFAYPKTWSVYVGKDGTSGEYEAYLHPVVVPTVANTQPYAVRVVIKNEGYDETLKAFERKVTTKELTSAPVTIGEFKGIRLDGAFTKERKGSTVVFKVRDKTLMVASDSESFTKDFNETVLPSLSFNP